MFSNYLKVFLASLILIGGAAIGFNWIIDPFYLFQGVRLQGVNTIKTEFESRARLAKAFHMKYFPDRFEGLIIGSSRAEGSLSSTHPGWEGKRVYNLSLPGGSIYELSQYYQLALQTQKIETVVLALDFFMFNAYREFRPDFNENILFVDKTRRPVDKYYSETLPILFSMDTIEASLKTIKNQHNPLLEVGTNLKRANRLKNEGLRGIFTIVEEQYLFDEWHGNFRKIYEFENKDAGVSTFQQFREILKISKDKNIELKIFLSPPHARLLSTLKRGGLWEKFEQWKIHLVHIVDDVNQNENNPPQIPLWDFSGYHAISTEELPMESNGEMEWYWEASHYKENVGSIILDTIFENGDPSRDKERWFGTLINSDNIYGHLSKIRKNQAEWEDTHPQDLYEIDRTIRKFNKLLIEVRKSKRTQKKQNT